MVKIKNSQMEKYKILLVEDDLNLGEILREYLEMKGYKTTLCRDGVEGLQVFKKYKFDLCILDIMMPKKDGFTLAKEIRQIDEKTPFIFLTAKSMKEDTLEGLRMGADDYITKPFSMEELLLRLKAILKRVYPRNQELQPSVYHFGKFTFDADSHLLQWDQQSAKLTTKEAALLKLLCQNKNQTLDRSEALKTIWREDTYFNARSMDVYITKLRKYLRDDENIQILTLHGQGFKLVDQTQNKEV
jgi:two-component system, OmpR family, response regulator VicR